MAPFGNPTLHHAYAASPYSPNELSYGLYWVGVNGENQKFVPGESNPYFDPAKPTLIFAHGWQPFISSTLPTFNFNTTDTAAAWVNDGWNVGIFVWNQFSDEVTGVSGTWFGDGPPPQGVLDAEAKIWTANGPRGMRWRDWDTLLPPLGDGYSDPPAGTPSAGELFYQAYTAAMTEQPYTGGVIRIAGHSLGNQMAVRLTHLVDKGIASGDVPEALRPTRVALLDPYWSPTPRNDLTDSDAAGRKTGDVIREYITELIPTGTLFEWYWSSDWTTPPQGDANDALKPMVLYAEMDPAFEVDELNKHLAAQHLYFWSYAFDGPSACTGEECLTMNRLLSRMSDEQLAAVMRSDYRWSQEAGQNTATAGDDTYTATQQSDAPYHIASLTATPASQMVGNNVTITATAPDAPDGTLVSLSTNLGTITPRTVFSEGEAVVTLTADEAGTATVGATTLGTGGTVQSTTTVTFTTEQDDEPTPTPKLPTVQFSSASYTASETDGNAFITVHLSGSASQEVTVDYATSDGTATADSDYTATSGTLTIPAEQLSTIFPVPITSDTETEGDETLSLTLSNPTGATLGDPISATLTITDEETGEQSRTYMPLVIR
jgi:hypothetical protein